MSSYIGHHGSYYAPEEEPSKINVDYIRKHMNYTDSLEDKLKEAVKLFKRCQNAPDYSRMNLRYAEFNEYFNSNFVKEKCDGHKKKT